jgi:hypothetical protein
MFASSTFDRKMWGSRLGKLRATRLRRALRKHAGPAVVNPHNRQLKSASFVACTRSCSPVPSASSSRRWTTRDEGGESACLFVVGSAGQELALQTRKPVVDRGPGREASEAVGLLDGERVDL